MDALWGVCGLRQENGRPCARWNSSHDRPWDETRSQERGTPLGAGTSADALVDDDGHDHAAVLRLRLAGVIGVDRVGGPHRGGCEDACHGNDSALLDDGEHGVSTFLAQTLIQGWRAYLRREALYLDHVARCICSGLHEVVEGVLILL